MNKEKCVGCGKEEEYIDDGEFGKTWIVRIIGGFCDGCRYEQEREKEKALKEMYGH